MSKRILAMLLALVMVLSLVPTFAMAEETETEITNVAKVGETEYATLEEALAQAENAEEITIELLSDATCDVAAWEHNAIGGESTKTVTINGNTHTLTFNHTNSDWNNVATKGAKLIINNAKITNSGHNNSAWNRHDINFGCEVELNNVTSDKALAFKSHATLNTVTITEDYASDVYGIWIQAKGQTVSLTDVTIDTTAATDGRGITINDQYVEDTCAKVTLTANGLTIKSEEKGAIIVKSAAGADITLSNVNIENTIDPVYAVWVDEDRAGAPVSVTGAKKILEGAVAEVDGVQYASLAAAIAEGGEVKVLNDTELTEVITINSDVTITADEAVTITTAKTDVFTVGEGGDLTLGENIKVVSNTSVLYANGGTINVDGTEITVSGSQYNAAFAENNGTINVKAGSVSQTDSKVTVAATNATVNVSGGTIHSENDSAVAALTGATVNITDGTVSTNATALRAAAYAEGGKIVVDGGSVKSLNKDATSYALIAVLDGSAVEVKSGTVAGTYGSVLAHRGENANATISGGTIEGQVAAQEDGKLNIIGGTFDADPSAYVAAGYAATEKDGKYIVAEEVDDGINTEAELAAAIAAGQTEIALTGGFELTEVVTINSDVTITAENPVTITTAKTDVFTVGEGGNLTLGKNITVESSSSVLYANGGTINVNGTEITVSGSQYNAAFAENNGTINVKAGSISQSDNKVTVAAKNATVNVSGGTIHSENDSAIAALTGATVNITGGTVSTNATALRAAAYAEGGKIVVDGGSVKSLNEDATSYALIAVLDGSAVEVKSGTVAGTYGSVLAHRGENAKATISGGTIEGQIAAQEDGKLAISGGTFSKDPSAYVAEGKVAVLYDNVYVIETKKVAEEDDVTESGNSVVAGNTSVGVVEGGVAGITGETLKDAVESNEDTAKNLVAAVIENNVAVENEEEKKAEAAEQLDAEADDIELEIRPYLDVKVTDFEENTLTVEIEAVYDVVAVAGNKEVTVTEAAAMEIEETNITITLPLPANFDVANKFVYVKHIKDAETSYTYEATVSADGKTITFVNPNGFSEFQVYTSDEKIDDEPVIELAKIAGTSMVLEEAIDINFWIKESALNAEAGAYAVITFNGADTTVPMAQWGASGIYHKIGFQGVAAKEMCDDIKIVIKAADGTAISQEFTYTVGKAIVDLHNSNDDADMKELAVAMLNYGAAAQKAFDYNENDLATKYLADLNASNG